MLSSYLGFYALIGGLITSIIIVYSSTLNLKEKNQVLDSKIIPKIFIQFFFVNVAFFSLLYSFINSDFSNETVYNNSHTTKPLFYKITGLWGNHEGSLLLWLLVLTGLMLAFSIKSKNEPKTYRLLTILFQETIIIGFFIFVLKTSSPFSIVFPTPEEGLGLNPILQDPALGIHPPILYLGYVGTSIIFSSALSAMVCGYVNKVWAKNIKFWVFFSWIFLTGGILLGSIWAYYELGWGGFWFWDPVENISLMPWLSLTALVHCIVTLEKREILKKWTVILSIITFTLSMAGTFLVRSGILNSVHTFANDPARGIYILGFLFILILISFIIFFIYENKYDDRSIQISFLSKEASIMINNWFVLYFLSVVLIGTMYPIFLDVLTNTQISVGPPFYNKLIIPFLIPFFLFMSIGPSLRWIKTDFKIKFSNFISVFFAIILSFTTLYFLGEKNIIIILLFLSAFYLLFKNLIDLINKRTNTAQVISHLGFSLLMISILVNGISSKEVIKNLKVGESLKLNNEKVFLKSVEIKQIKNYESIIGNFEIINLEKKDKLNMYPELRIYNAPRVVTSEAAIKTTLFEDKFITINIIDGNDVFNVRYQKKPFMVWVWISTLTLILGGTLAFFAPKKKNNI